MSAFGEPLVVGTVGRWTKSVIRISFNDHTVTMVRHATWAAGEPEPKEWTEGPID